MKNIVFLISKNCGFNIFKTFYEEFHDKYRVILITVDDTSDIRSCYCNIMKFCGDKGVEIYVLPNPKKLGDVVNSLNPDTMFVCGWYWIINKSILDSVENGTYGIHHSLLPKYRGFSPLVWSMINGDDVIGSTLFRFKEGVDDGDIYHQWSVPRESRRIGNVIDDLEEDICKSFNKIFNSIVDRKAFGHPQPDDGASYCARRLPEHGRIDWCQQAEHVKYFVDALSDPYPGAFTYYDNKKIILSKCQIFDSPVYAQPGQIILNQNGSTVIACGKTTGLRVTEIKCDDESIFDVSSIFKSIDVVLR